jgi:hypothetical protein
MVIGKGSRMVTRSDSHGFFHKGMNQILHPMLSKDQDAWANAD